MTTRASIRIRGAVQGVGFRPFVYRLATELGVHGWVINGSDGVLIDAEGEEETLRRFLLDLERRKPPRSFIQSFEHTFLDPAGYPSFEIRASASTGTPTTLLLPDIALCPECLSEIRTPGNRRYRYPFTNCTNCGPRYSIIESLPYDRPRTTMNRFVLCEDCRREYFDPADRRFHAQPIACPACGPHVELWDARGRLHSSHGEALQEASERIAQGEIVAVKGLGGFHLMAHAGREETVKALRARKHREEKPFAIMAPSLEAARGLCTVSPEEERLLISPEAPIVLLRRAGSAAEAIAPSVAPGNPFLGVMLPYTPLHRLLLDEIGTCVVATSGNLSDEPLCTDEHEALRRLDGIADWFLVHNRPIARYVDDSIVRVMLHRELVLRRARGYAPLPVHLGRMLPESTAVGAHLKNTVAYARGSDVFVSQHIGDLETAESFDAFRSTLRSLGEAYAMKPVHVAADMHPDYLSTGYAHTLDLPVIPVQHHHAHVLSCMAENRLEGQVLGVSWDGTGYGPDGTIWGGEFLLADADAFTRFASFRSFLLPGGEAAVREPRRSMMGMLYEVFGDRLFDDPAPVPPPFSPGEMRVLRSVLEKRVNAPTTSSAGRLFDGVASLAGCRHIATYEGQAALELECAAHREPDEAIYPISITNGDPAVPYSPLHIVDWEPMIRAILGDIHGGISPARIASRFHHTMACIIVEIARKAKETRIVLSGGCFQNAMLTEDTVCRLQTEGFQPYWHQRVPPNDGGIALGQIIAAAGAAGKNRFNHQLTKETCL